MIRDRPTAFAPTLPLLLFGLYLLIMLAQTSLLAPSGRSDDLETLLLSQSMAWGYQAKNPPAFYWLAHGVTLLAGPSMPAIYALRFAGLFAAVAGLYAVARRLQPDPLLAIGAGFGILATLHFHWYLLFYLTNTMLALAMTPLAVLAMLKLRRRPTTAAYALLGLAVGIGLLARYNFALVAAGLLVAGLSLPGWRSLFLRRRALVTAGIIAALVLPHAVWVGAHAHALAADAAGQIIGDADYPARVAEGLEGLGVSSISILVFPFGLALIALMPAALRRIRVGDPERAADLALVGRTIGVGFGLVAAYALAGGAYVRPHHLFFLSLVPVWVIGRLDRAFVRPWAPAAFAGMLAACCIAAALAFPIASRRDAASCNACEEFQPVAQYAGALRAVGFVPGTIVALSKRQDFPTAALLAYLPGARLVAYDYPLYAPPAGTPGGDCLLVWSGAEAWPATWRQDAPVPGIGLPVPEGATIGQMTGRLVVGGRSTAGMRYLLVKGGVGDCR